MQESIEKEANAWSWLKGFQTELPGYKELFDLNTRFSRENSKAIPSDEKLESLLEDFHNLVETKGIILSTSTSGRFINSLEDKRSSL